MSNVLLAGCESLAPAVPSPESASAPSDEIVARLEAMNAACLSKFDALQETNSANADQLANQTDVLQAVKASLEQLAQAQQNTQEVVAIPACPEIEEPLQNKLIVGRNEKVWLEDFQLILPARIDTGAETASLDARDIREFERDGDAWVRFDIQPPDSDEYITLEREIARTARILQSSSEKAERRVVIELGIVIGNIRQQAEFTLSDRSHLDFQVLVGRNILQDLMIVDVGRFNVAPVQISIDPDDSRTGDETK